MMKKLHLFGLALVFCTVTIKSQNNSTAVYRINDTLQYYFNKFYYKTNTSFTAFPSYKSPAATGTAVTHCGSRFENPCDTFYVTGLQSFAYRNLSSVSLVLPLHMYLCKLDAAGLPILPPVDSVVTSVTGAPTLKLVRGNFKNNKVHKMVGDFAVLFRNLSTISGDTIRLIRTNSKANTTPGPYTERYTDNYGYARHIGKFYSTTNFTVSGFGNGTAYEFCVAPEGYYDVWAGHIAPAKGSNNGDPLCTHQPIEFANNSSCRWTHRMYNLTEFYRKWNTVHAPFLAPAPTGGWPTDSAITWYFEPQDGKVNERIFLPYGGTPNKIKFSSDSAWKDVNGQDTVYCFDDNEFRAHFWGMSIFGRGVKLDFPNDTFKTKFTLCTQFCNGDNVGLAKNSLSQARIYPNPVNGNRIYVSGLVGINTISVHDVLGRLISSGVTDKADGVIGIDKLQAGTYVVKITNTDGSTKVVKVIKTE